MLLSIMSLISSSVGIHLTDIILKVWVINGQYVIDVSICEVELRCLPFPIGRDQGLYGLCMKYCWTQRGVIGVRIPVLGLGIKMGVNATITYECLI